MVLSDEQRTSSDEPAGLGAAGGVGMSDGERAEGEALRAVRVGLRIGRQGPRSELPGSGGVSLGPADRSLAARDEPAVKGRLVAARDAAAGRDVFYHHGHSHRGFVPVIVLLRPPARTQVPDEHADLRPLAGAILEAESAGGGVLAGTGLGALLADLVDSRLVVAGGGGGVFCGQHRAGAIGAGVDSAAVLPHRKARRSRTVGSARPACRGDGPFESRASIAWT